jgi:hypothetical protein
MATRSEQYAATSIDSLGEERAACLKLTTDDYAGSERVKEFHADCADRISDELQARAETT